MGAQFIPETPQDIGAEPAITDASAGARIAGATAKTVPVDADVVGLSDSAAGGILKKLSWTNIKAVLKVYFDSLYPSGSGTSTGTNTGDETTSRINALYGYTPLSPTGSQTNTTGIGGDVQTALNAKQASLGFTAENVAKKDTDTSLAANSDTNYPSQKAVKAYADTKLSPTGSAAGLTSFPTFNQNTTGSAAKLTTPRLLNGVSFDGSADITIPPAASYQVVRVLAQSATPVSIGGTLNETTLATYSLPSGVMGLNGAVRVTAVWTITSSANTKIVRHAWGGSFIGGGGSSTTTNKSISTQTLVRNRNAVNYQFDFSGTTSPYGIAASNITTYTKDTSGPVAIAFSALTTLETGFTPSPTSNVSGTGSVVTIIQTAHGLNTGEYIKASGSSTGGYNVDPVAITKIDANTFTYAGTGTGTPGTAPLIQRYSVITLEGYTIELLPGAN
jgi:hypothetical protein